MEYIIVQNVIDKENGTNISMSTIVRRVIASSKEEAIGKFVLETKDRKCVRKLEISECIDYRELKQIN